MAFCPSTPQEGVPKLQQLGLSQLWRCITSFANFWSQWSLKQSCSPRRDLSNGMLHVACMQGNWVDSWLLVVGSQIANLTPDLSFDHNLCFRFPNGRCEPNLDIYVSIGFQWYKERFTMRNFDPFNHALKIRESIRDSNSQHGSSLGSVRVHSLTLFALPGACEMTPVSPSWPTTLSHLALVANSRLGLRQGVGIPMDSWICRGQFQGSKPIGLKIF
jgi:hypothetical protein